MKITFDFVRLNIGIIGDSWKIILNIPLLIVLVILLILLFRKIAGYIRRRNQDPIVRLHSSQKLSAKEKNGTPPPDGDADNDK